MTIKSDEVTKGLERAPTPLPAKSHGNYRQRNGPPFIGVVFRKKASYD